MASILKVNELKDAGGNAIITSNGSGAVTYSGVDLNGTELVLDADADTSITADTDDQIDIRLGGVDEITMSSSGIVINEGSNDRDFRIESNGNTHMLFVDGGNDRVHINGSTGTREFNVSGDNTRLLLYSTNNSTGAGQLQFGDADNEQIGRIMYEHDGNKMTFHTAATEAMRIDGSGHITKPLQSAFNARHSSAQSNLDINAGAAITIVMANEIFDQNADYNTSTSTFTAPVTGRYQLNFHTYMADVDDDFAYLQLDLVTSNRQYNIILENSGEDGYDHFSIAVLADMDASDTALVKIQGSGGADQLDLSQSSFSGFLAC